MTPTGSSDLYLNTLCLAAWAPGESSMRIAKAVVQMYDGTSIEEKSSITPINKLYISLLTEVTNGTLDLSNRSEALNALMKYKDNEAFAHNPGEFDKFIDMLAPPEQLPSKIKIKRIFDSVKNNIMYAKNSRRLKMMMVANQKAGATTDVEKQRELLKQIMDDAADFRSIYESQLTDEEKLVPVDEIDMSDPKSVLRAVQQQHRKRNSSIIRFGLQGFNRMFGPNRGAAYGEVMAIAARSHHYKSGMLMDIARWICTLNDPPETGGLRPVVLFISLENEVGENLMDWYKKAYANAFHKSPAGLTDEEIVNYVVQLFNSRGFNMLVLRRMGENFGYREFVEAVEKIEKNGCKVVATVLDYITLCRRCPEDKNFNDARQTQQMVARFKDFAAHREMFFCTGLQLETEAARLASSGQTNIVKQYSEFHLADCKGIKRELDILFFQEIETNHRGVPYLTLSWNKHRYEHNTLPEDKYTAYRFTDLGILNDIDGPDQSVRDIYADGDESGNEESISLF